jgi:hypothetical protein
MRLRQAVWVARDLDATAAELERELGVRDPYRDPGVEVFGLQNVVYPIGDAFLEIVSPTQANTTAGRYLERRGGDGGYMLLVQVDDFDEAMARIKGLRIRTVWNSGYPDIQAAHLHPKDTGGTLVSLDEPDPPASWRWGGSDWESRSRAGSLDAVEIQSEDPAALSARWSEFLGRDPYGLTIALDQGTIRFVEASDGRGEGLSGIDVSVPSESPRTISLGGVRLQISTVGQ